MVGFIQILDSGYKLTQMLFNPHPSTHNLPDLPQSSFVCFSLVQALILIRKKKILVQNKMAQVPVQIFTTVSGGGEGYEILFTLRKVFNRILSLFGPKTQLCGSGKTKQTRSISRIANKGACRNLRYSKATNSICLL